MKNRAVLVALILVIAIGLAGCFPHTPASGERSPSGFFMGIWHGWIAPLSVIIGFFDSDIRVYDSNNTGWWYDLGFYIAVISGFGGVAFSRTRKKQV